MGKKQLAAILPIFIFVTSCTFVDVNIVSGSTQSPTKENIISTPTFLNTHLSTKTQTPTQPPLPSETIVPASPIVKEKTVIVHAYHKWVDTGIDIIGGQSVTIASSGIVNTWKGKNISFSDANGQPEYICNRNDCALQYIHYGTLVGRIGHHDPFRVGVYFKDILSTSGRLYLTVNDWYYSDNLGEFTVEIEFQQPKY